MENPAFVMMLMMLPALLATVITSMNAKKTNAMWRERRAARAHAKASAE